MSEVSTDVSAFDICVFIGRFRPLHNGHMTVILEALRRGKYVVIIVGSINEPRNLKNVFFFQEVREMIRAALPADALDRVLIFGQEDQGNLRRWTQQIQEKVATAAATRNLDNPSVALIGHAKDGTSFYLKLFPQWGAINVEDHTGLSAVNIRNELFFVGGTAYADNWLRKIAPLVPSSTIAFMREFMTTDDYGELVIAAEKNEKELIAWGMHERSPTRVPFPVQFMCADAVALQGSNILLVKRGGYPGKGLWALPGGFVEQDQTFADAALAELVQETAIDVDHTTLRASMVDRDIFDDPKRSWRTIRTMSVAHTFLLEPRPAGKTPVQKRKSLALPKVIGSDDAEKAKWWTLEEFSNMRSVMFEDHFNMANKMIDRLADRRIQF